MAGIDDVLERLITDAGFKRQLAEDPRSALAGYDLATDDLELLASQVSDSSAGMGAVEQRTSKAGLFGLFSQLLDTGGGGGAPAAMHIEDGGLDDQGLQANSGDVLDPDTMHRAPGGGVPDGSEVEGLVLEERPGGDADAVMFNPQPDPPGSDPFHPGGEVGFAESSELPGDDVMFNPQPDPPGTDPFHPGGEVGFGESSELPGDDVMFNPQPDPPGSDPFHPGGEIGLAESSELPSDLGARGGEKGIIIEGGDVAFGESSERVGHGLEPGDAGFDITYADGDEA